MANKNHPSVQLAVMLRKLLEAKDAAVRVVIAERNALKDNDEEG